MAKTIIRADRDAADQITAHLPNLREATGGRPVVSMLHLLTWTRVIRPRITGELRAPFPAGGHVELTHGDCYYYALVARKP